MENQYMNVTYRHYKGDYYKTLLLAKHTETEEDMVVYESLKDHKIWTRPRKMFEEMVEIDGKQVPRFQYVDYRS